MHVLLAGGTGFVGTALARELVDRGHDVTALSRSPDGADLPEAVQTVAGDVTDPESVRPAFEGQDVVVNLVALSPLYTPSGGNEMHERVHVGGTRTVVECAAAAGVSRVVQMSALGADPDGATAYVRAKGEAENVVRDGSPSWTVIRPSVVFGDGGEFVDFTTTLTTPYVTGLPGGGRTRFQPIWVGDLAAMLADAATEETHAGRTYELGGPEVLTLAEVAKLVYRSRGRPLTVLPVPMALARVGLTLGGAIPGFPMGPDQYRSLRFDNTVADNDVTAFGRDPSSLRTLGAYLGVASDAGDGSPDGGGGADDRSPDGGGTDGPSSDGGGTDGPSSDGGGTDGPSSDGGSRPVSTARTTLLLFGYLVLARQLPQVVDVSSSVGYGALFAPPYVVSLLLYDGPLGLERLAYPVASLLPLPGELVWEVGQAVTYYGFACAVVWLARRARFGRETARAAAP